MNEIDSIPNTLGNGRIALAETPNGFIARVKVLVLLEEETPKEPWYIIKVLYAQTSKPVSNPIMVFLQLAELFPNVEQWIACRENECL